MRTWIVSGQEQRPRTVVHHAHGSHHCHARVRSIPCKVARPAHSRPETSRPRRKHFRLSARKAACSFGGESGLRGVGGGWENGVCPATLSQTHHETTPTIVLCHHCLTPINNARCTKLFPLFCKTSRQRDRYPQYYSTCGRTQIRILSRLPLQFLRTQRRGLRPGVMPLKRVLRPRKNNNNNYK